MLVYYMNKKNQRPLNFKLWAQIEIIEIHVNLFNSNPYKKK